MIKKLKKSLFITFEGLEGTGKSTQAELLSGRLREIGYEVVATREPGGTRIGEKIRKITHDPENIDLTSKAEAYLMAAARAQHVAEIIKPALIEGKIVVCDRFLDSSIVYQGYGRQLGAGLIKELNNLAVNGLLPDLTILLQLSIEEGIDRRNSTSKVDRLDLQQKEFYKRVEKGYGEIAGLNKERIKIVDGNDTIEKVSGKVWQLVKKALSL